MFATIDARARVQRVFGCTIGQPKPWQPRV
jgi:hypothetical protein